MGGLRKVCKRLISRLAIILANGGFSLGALDAVWMAFFLSPHETSPDLIDLLFVRPRCAWNTVIVLANHSHDLKSF